MPIASLKLVNIARSSNGRTTVSGTVYLGSSPSLATKNSVAVFAARNKTTVILRK